MSKILNSRLAMTAYIAAALMHGSHDVSLPRHSEPQQSPEEAEKRKRLAQEKRNRKNSKRLSVR